MRRRDGCLMIEKARIHYSGRFLPLQAGVKAVLVFPSNCAIQSRRFE